jgi:hypothetical protein
MPSTFLLSQDASDGASQIRTHEAAPPVDVPPGHVGPVVLPGTGRMVYWTGRVAIGLRHETPRHYEMTSSSALWLQDLMLRTRSAVQAA